MIEGQVVHHHLMEPSDENCEARDELLIAQGNHDLFDDLPPMGILVATVGSENSPVHTAQVMAR